MVLCSGAFDGLHAGHVRYLSAARTFATGDTLRVAIAPDSYITHQKHRQPKWTQSERAATVFALACVDDVILQHEDSVAQVIREWHPRTFVKGADWQDQLPEDVLAACFESGTAIVYVNTPGRHTSETRG